MKKIFPFISLLLIAGGINAQVALEAVVYLQGPYAGGGMMNTRLHSLATFPLTQPYNTPPWNYSGQEAIASVPDSVVDWVLVELRSAPDTVVDRRAGLLLRNGHIADPVTMGALAFSLVGTASYYLAIHHRNHLAVMSAYPMALPNATAYDFTDTLEGPAWGGSGRAMINLGTGEYGMIAGDVNNNNQLKYSGPGNDRSLILQKIIQATGSSSITATTGGYHQEDLTMDSVVKYSGPGNDPSKIIQNIVVLTGSGAITGVYNGLVPAAVLNMPFGICGNTLTDTRDGQQYPTVLIGTQCWMAKNVNVGNRINGSQNQLNNAVIEKYCYNDDTNNCNTYGGLYQWDEMMGYDTTPRVQGICPAGWHIPADAEWTTLANYMIANGYNYDGTTTGNKIAKALASASGWLSSTKTGVIGNTDYPTYRNKSGFTALGAGQRIAAGGFSLLTYDALLWSSSQYSTVAAYYRDLSYAYTDLYRGNRGKTIGYSVRCVQDTIPCTSQPDQANAGSDSLNIAGDSLQLYANQPTNGTGVWRVVTCNGIGVACSGTIITDSTLYNSMFHGYPGTAYSLVWTITTSCGSSRDTVNISFAAAQGFTCGNTLTDSRDGKQYPTVQIGTQCWMAKNLNVGVYKASVNTGSNHSDVSNNGIIEKYCYNNDTNQCNIYGGLYDGNEMMGYVTTPGVQGICPAGWHVPTDAEWCSLTTFLDASVNCSTWGWSGTNAGGKLKESGFTHWTSPNTGATNSSGFTALAGGYRHYNGSFLNLTLNADFWSSSENSSTNGIYRVLAYYGAAVGRNYDNKTDGFSIRCLRDI